MAARIILKVQIGKVKGRSLDEYYTLRSVGPKFHKLRKSAPLLVFTRRGRAYYLVRD
jgi:hypothetical protein